MERATKLVIVIAAIGLLAFDLSIGRAWSGNAQAATAFFLAAAILTAYDRRAVGLVLAFACVFPALVRLTLETYAVQFDVQWMAALLGAIVPDALTSRWHVPRRWRGPLVLAALAVAVATPIVVLREIDFNPELLGAMPGAILSGLPSYFAEWVAQVGLTMLLGVLWYDWLAGARDLDFESAIILPLGGSMVAMALVSVYQVFAEISFLNETVYAGVGRASGTMYDANVCGTLAAIGIGGAMFCAGRYPGRRRIAALAATSLFGIAVWASGSRTATAAALIVVVSSIVTLRRSRHDDAPTRLGPWILSAAALVLVVLVATAADTAVTGPLRRLWEMLPGAPGHSVGQVASELWNRNGYGAASNYLITRFPLSGIGIGSFHIFGVELSPFGTLPPDNAQNWYRHQLVEMGVLGSVGWLAFAALFAWYLVRPPASLDASAGHVRGILLAFALISLVGVPTQQVTAAIVFWTAAAWYGRLGGLAPAAARDRVPLGIGAWVVILLIVAAFGAGTLHAAMGNLRVPARARQMAWPYSYGFYGPEPDGTGGQVRWTARRATALVDVTGATLTLTVRAPYSDLPTNPLGVKVWSEGRLVIDVRLSSGEPVTATVPLAVGLRQTLLDVRTSRTVRPRDLGVADDRELGVIVKWEFSN